MILVNIFGSIGYSLFAVLVLASATFILAVLGGLTFSMFSAATAISSADKNSGIGTVCGASTGFFWSLCGFYYTGVVPTLVSLFGLCAVVAAIAWVFWFISEQNRPVGDRY